MKGATAVVALAVLLWCCEGFLATNPLPSFPVPDNLDLYAQNTQSFFSIYENLYPSTNGTVLYAARTREPGSDYTQHIVLQARGVVNLINTTANASLLLGRTFAAFMPNNDLFLFYEVPTHEIFANLFTAHYNLATRQLRTQPVLWSNPPIPEPTYNTSGFFMGNRVDNNSQVVDAQTSLGSYSATFSSDGRFVYILVRTDFFGSLKLLKYNAQDGSFIWRQIIKPEIIGRTGTIPSGLKRIQIDPSTQDLFLLQDVVAQEVAAMYKYLNITHSGPLPTSTTNLLLRVDHNTGNIVDSGFIDLNTVPGGSPFNTHITPTSMTLHPSQGLLYLTINGQLKSNPINRADMLLQYSISDLNNNKGTRKSVLLSLIPQAVADSCHPATLAFLVRSTAFWGDYFYLTGGAGYRQELTGSVTAGGKAFLARVDLEELMAGKETAIKMEYFGVNSRENSGSQIAIGSDGSFYLAGVFNRGLTHDPPEKANQNAVIYVKNNNTFIYACAAGQDWWLSCKDADCLEWCFPFPNITDEKPFQECVPEPPPSGDDDDWSDATIAGVVIGIAAGLFVAVLCLVAVVWGLYKLRQYRRGYVEVDGGVDHKINEAIARGLK